MSNILTKQYSQVYTTVPEYIIKRWIPGYTTFTYVPYGLDNNGNIVSPIYTVSRTATTFQITTTQYHSLPITSTGLEGGVPLLSYSPSWAGVYNVVILGWNSSSVVTPGHYVYDIQPNTTTLSISPITGWSGSALSISSLSGDCTAYFSFQSNISGGVCGLNIKVTSAGSGYLDIPFGIHASKGYYKIVENGIFKTINKSFVSTDIFSITRNGTRIMYLVNGNIVYYSLNTTSVDFMVDCSLYTSGDAVYNASFRLGSSVIFKSINLTATSGVRARVKQINIKLRGNGTLTPPVKYKRGSNRYVVLTTISGTSALNIVIKKGRSVLQSTSSLTITYRRGGGVTSFFKKMSVLSTSGYPNYSAVVTSFKSLSCVALSGVSIQSLPAAIASSMAPMVSNGISLSGGTTTPSAMALKKMVCLASNKVYSSVAVSMKSMSTVAYIFTDLRDVGKNAHIREIESINSTLLFYQLANLVERLVLSGTVLDKVTAKVILLEYLSTITTLTISLNGSVSESLVISSSILSLLTKIEVLTAVLSTTTLITTKVSLASTILELIKVLSTLDRLVLASVSESLVVSSTLSSLYKAIVSLLGNINDVGAVSDKVIKVVGLSELLVNSSTLSSKVLFKNILSESFLITIPSISGGETYLAYLLSPETNSISNYDNYNFSGSTKFGFKYLFSNSTGLYEYGGNTDDSALITARLETVAYDFGSSNLKQVPAVYLGYTSSGSTIMKVSVNGKSSSIYKLNKRTENLQTQKIDIGKGLIGRYFQFELITQAPDFSMESIEFYPIELRRKL